MNYYVQGGGAAKADKIRAAFEKLGYDVETWRFTTGVYYTLNGRIVNTNIGSNEHELILNNPDYKELPIGPMFKVGDWLYHNTLGVLPIIVEDYSELQDYKVVCRGTHYCLQKGVVEREYHLWTIADAKDGDVLCTYEGGNPKIVFILRGNPEGNCSVLSYYCYYNIMYPHFEPNAERGCLAPKREDVKPATKEQRDLLFAKMREAGYTWDEKKKELCKIIEPQFKVGDDIKTGNTIETIAEVDHDTRSYYCESGRTIYFANQDLWHLVPKPHYDIANFHAGMPVLVRDYVYEEWRYVQFSHIREIAHALVFDAGCQDWYQCIPFNEDTKHLLGTTDMCDEQYINW